MVLMVKSEGSQLSILLGLTILTFGLFVGCGPSTPELSSEDTSSTGRSQNSVGAGHSFVYQGPLPQTFHESPSLAEGVAKGELPPVSERLPEEPLVIPPVERIGKYGGTWNRAFTGPEDRQNIDRLVHDHVIYYDLDGVTLVPHIARSWEVKEDGRVFIFHLRKGMKWSDGHPFTADDFVFAYQDLILNDELSPAKPSWFQIGEQFGRVTKLDEWTVRYEYAQPYHVFLELFAGLQVGGQGARARYFAAPFAPAHYLKQFHQDYVGAEKIQLMVSESGLGSWFQFFRQKVSPQSNPDLPVVAPWKTVQPITSQQFVLERNPYYWAVDPEGNQLPYIDRISMRLATNPEVLSLWAISGELDMQHRHIQLAKVPVLKENAKKLGYRVLMWPDAGGSEAATFVNQTYEEDAEIANWLRNPDFRQALSLAVDRDAINETIFLGTGTPRKFLPPPGSPYYPGEEHEAVRLDREEANRILDRIGLKQKGEDGFRLRADGKGRLVIRLASALGALLDFPGVAELLAAQWAEVGLWIDAAVEERSLFLTRLYGNQQQLALWGTGGAENLWAYPSFTIPTIQYGINFAPLVSAWYQSGGKQGRAPRGPIKRLVDLYEQGKSLPRDQRIALGQEIWRIHAKELYVIGTVGLSPALNGVVVVRDIFRNVPDVAPNSPTLQNPGIARTEQFFFDN